MVQELVQIPAAAHMRAEVMARLIQAALGRVQQPNGTHSWELFHQSCDLPAASGNPTTPGAQAQASMSCNGR